VSAQLRNTLSRRNSFIGTTFWMAPEVIQEKEYDEKADTWSMGITAIEMAELTPPHHDLHPVRAIFAIPKDPPPRLQDAARWSRAMHDFVARCLVKDPAERPSAAELLAHPFVAGAIVGSPSLVPTIDEFLRLSAEEEVVANPMPGSPMPTGLPGEAAPPPFPSADSALVLPDASSDGCGSDATMIEHDASSIVTGGADEPRHVTPACIRDGTVIPLPLVILDDVSLSELGDVQLPELTAHYVSTLLSDRSAPSTAVAMTATQSGLLKCFAYRKDRLYTTGVPEEVDRCKAAVSRYGSLLKTILKV
jgi:serine/threonine protein kinase